MLLQAREPHVTGRDRRGRRTPARGCGSHCLLRQPLSKCETWDVRAPGVIYGGPVSQIQNKEPTSVGRAIERLRSLRDGYSAVTEVVACGKNAVPALRALLFEREPSGLFQVRCLAIKALAALRAHDVLVEFLTALREAADPVERIGDDVVANAAAGALARSRQAQVFELLLWLAETRPLPGVIAALGISGRAEAIPYLIEALTEDESRFAAEAALRKFGARGHQALIVAACKDSLSLDRESESRLRQRRSALELLAENGIQPEQWPVLRNLMQDEDPKIAVLACKICLLGAPETEKCEAVSRLKDLLPSADFVLGQEIEHCLAIHMSSTED